MYHLRVNAVYSALVDEKERLLVLGVALYGSCKVEQCLVSGLSPLCCFCQHHNEKGIGSTLFGG